jgi:transcriptional regulator with XRE-family HTH domain
MQYRPAMKASVKADPARGLRLKALRKRRGLTQLQVAHELGVEKSSVSRWETGEVFPRDSLNGLVELYGTDPEYITFGVESVDDTETFPAFDEFLAWLKTSVYANPKITPDWMIEALRTMRPRLPADVEPNLEVYKHLHQAMLAMPRRK